MPATPINPYIKERRTALCYIRQSQTREGDESDKNSPERQRSNIELICQKNDWVAEWYEDVGGHRSGTSEGNRPEWIALKNRIGHPDVVAVVANDLSRLHRNLAGTTQLLDILEKHGVSLVLAASNNDIDVTTLTGQMFAQIRALMDAFYAKDISAKAKDSVAYRKRLGKTIGMPPFGTERNKDGYLMPTSKGAWLLPDGRFISGTPDERPIEAAVWRSYYACAELILKKYAERHLGMHRIAYEINAEGWAFRDRKDNPRPISEEDVRRVLSNWSEYGGLVYNEKSKDRRAYEPLSIDEIAFVPERAVFPIELLKTVARLRHERSVRPVNHGINRDTHPYALAGITFCAHCEQLTLHHQNPKLRSRLGGAEHYGKRRYRHKAGVSCGCKNRSVFCQDLEADFGKLLKLLTVKPDMLDLMTELAIQSEKGFRAEAVDWEAEKQTAIALCRRRIDAAVNLYRDGVISREDYLQDVERNRREIAHWEARTHETQQIAIELAMCLHVVTNLTELWDQPASEERQALARSLFTEIIYDLDTRQIVDFKLKPWADRFLVVRAALYEPKDKDKDGDDSGSSGENMSSSNDLIPLSTEGSSQPVWGISRLLEKPGRFYCFLTGKSK